MSACSIVFVTVALICFEGASGRDVVIATDINGPVISSSGTVSARNATLRTPADMQHDTDLVARVPIAAVAMINRPTIPLAEYNSLKAMYDHAPAAERQRARQGLAALGAQQTPIVQGINFAGAQEGGPLGRAALGKRNREVSQANHVMASAETGRGRTLR